MAGIPQWLRLRTPERDTVLYPAISYPTYAMGATLAGCRAVPVPVDDRWRIRLDAIDPADADRALCLWVNTPGNPAGGLDDLGAAAAWGRERGVPVLSDECYAEFTWDGPPRTILEHGAEGVVAVHSLSKRSNFAGARAGFYAGDADLVRYLSEVRKHAGFMVPGPVQAAGAVAWGDDAHVVEQAARYHERLVVLVEALRASASTPRLPGGAFYLWVPAPDGDAWALARRLAAEGGALVSPGEFYGPAGAGHVRVAAVQPLEQIQLLAERLTPLTNAARRASAGPRRPVRSVHGRDCGHAADDAPVVRRTHPAGQAQGPGGAGARRRCCWWAGSCSASCWRSPAWSTWPSRSTTTSACRCRAAGRWSSPRPAPTTSTTSGRTSLVGDSYFSPSQLAIIGPGGAQLPIVVGRTTSTYEFGDHRGRSIGTFRADVAGHVPDPHPPARRRDPATSASSPPGRSRSPRTRRSGRWGSCWPGCSAAVPWCSRASCC